MNTSSVFFNYVLSNYLIVLIFHLAIAESSVTSPAIQTNNYFSRELYQVIEEDDNLICSPLSAEISLETLRLGSEGNTKVQVENALNLPCSRSDDSFKNLLDILMEDDGIDENMLLLSRIYINESFEINQDFAQKIESMLRTELVYENLNNKEIVTLINEWIFTESNGNIKNIVEQNDFHTENVIFLINAISFNGLWETEFTNEIESEFYVNKTYSLPQTYLQLISSDITNDIRRNYLNIIQAELLDIPYQGGKFRFIIFLPFHNVPLSNLEDDLKYYDIDLLLRNSHKQYNLEVVIPKLNLESKLDLVRHFKELKMTDMFNEDLANFKNISTEPLYVSKIIQKAQITLSLNGTKASASTGVSIPRPVSAPPPPFKADRPFIFYLVYKSRVHEKYIILFNGRYVSP